MDAETAALGQLASAADGSMRDALSLLDQAIGYGGGTVSQQAVEAMLGSISHDSLLRLFEALKTRQAPEILRAARAVIEHNPDYQRICADMIGLLQQVALYQNDPRLVDGEEFPQEILQQYADAWAAEEVQLYYQILLQGRHDLLICPDQASGFEMLMLRLLAFAPAAAGETLSEEVKKKPESRRSLSTEPAVATVPASAVPAEANPIEVEPEKVKPTQIVQPDCARQPAPQAIDTDSPTVGHKAASDLEWSRLAYQLGLGGLAQEIAANSQLETCAADRLRLLLLPEIRELATAGIESEIRQALEQKLGVSLQLELAASESLSAETPLEAKTRRLEQERLRAIEAIREDEAVLKLKRAFAAELDETSVVRIDSNENEEVS